MEPRPGPPAAVGARAIRHRRPGGLDAGLVPDPHSGSGWCPPPTPGTVTRTSSSTPTASPTPTAPPRAIARKRRSSRASASSPSGTRWRCGGTTVSGVPASTWTRSRDPYADAVRELYASMGRSLWMIDLTSDLGIPVFGAISHRIGHRREDILLGFGAHLDPRIAAMRALTELNQFLPAIEQRDADGNTDYVDDDAGHAGLVARRQGRPASPGCAPMTAARRGTLARLPGLPAATTWRAARPACVRPRRRGRRAHRARPVAARPGPGRRPGDGPRHRHFWRRLGPGRLYDVPVKLGWLDEPTAEDKFNPLECLLLGRRGTAMTTQLVPARTLRVLGPGTAGSGRLERTLRLRRDAPLSEQSGAGDAVQIATPARHRDPARLSRWACCEAVRSLAREATTEQRLAALVTEIDGEARAAPHAPGAAAARPSRADRAWRAGPRCSRSPWLGRPASSPTRPRPPGASPRRSSCPASPSPRRRRPPGRPVTAQPPVRSSWPRPRRRSSAR